ncbi:Uncharacterised protein [Mycobacteroides abscessus]|uniref:hypothetical protein n=1 Tax=Mycobacteroides abscessus TaxID=36809 RepID=UPI0005DB5F96|nr:hypothetical protein [Mycobacteroides abscessus]MBN7316324.1 hypothetical protein [Mycobacteroides abscessus subsp. massiliense]CPU39954.1 Uncharacterised protein [Mycobacteroides abscessus]CPX60064.1 Uncharacterised protein [Mycobacteroides abscessus]CPZ30702.1 Uncharacterised protein [Mycobacteroides abscessus]
MDSIDGARATAHSKGLAVKLTLLYQEAMSAAGEPPSDVAIADGIFEKQAVSFEKL